MQNLDASQEGERNNAVVSWDAPTDAGTGGIVYYRVQVKKATSDWDSLINDDTTGSTTYNLYGLTLGTDYDVRVQAVSDYSGGDWTIFEYASPDPNILTITTCQQLQDLNSDADAWLDKIVLANDIDCDGIDFMPLGVNSNWSGGSSFYGSLDGQGHKIKNLTIDQSSWDVGLFYEAFYGTFENVHFEGGSVHGNGNVATLAGYGEDITISNVSSDLQIASEGNNAGGLVADLEYYRDGSLDHLAFTGDVTSGYSTGGLFGQLDVYNPGVQVSLTKSYSSGTVETPENSYAGGLIGYAYVENEDNDNMPDASFAVQNSYSTAEVLANYAAGGLIGSVESYNDGYVNSIASITLDKVYASGGVSAVGDKAGGLIGEVNSLDYAGENLTITSSFATGSVSADSQAYGLVGGENFADGEGTYTVDHNYYDLSGTGQNQRDYLDGIENGFGVNDANSEPDYFKNNSSNAPFSYNEDQVWDFENIWQTNASSYPTLRAASVTTSTNLVSAEDSTPIALEQGGCAAIDTAVGAKETSLSVTDPAYSYPVGFASFTLTGCDGVASVTATFTGTFDPNSVVIRKYNPSTHNYMTLTTDNGLTATTTTLNNQPALRVFYYVVDGGPLDADGQVNGTIVDPVGIGVNAVAAPNTGLGL